ncbi:NUDIX domain-containing protein [Nocardia sp. NBC_01388]|uniref:NUDIX domain-containing protein n=1 Tax=Nocardia sp. NBC_01388 TaxID=2903596 RepID=UPI002F90B4AA
MTTAKEGTQIMLVNNDAEVLMYLRDDFPHIPFPNMWSLLGGMLEEGETPAECIRREIEEEIGIILDPAQVEHYATRDCAFGIEHTYLARVGDLDITTLTLTEGQELRWFSENDTTTMTLAYADNEILSRWFAAQRATTAR